MSDTFPNESKPVDHLSRPRTVVVATLLAAAVVSGGWLVQRGVSSPRIPPLRGPMLFDQVRYYVGHLYLDTLSDEVIYRSAIEGMMSDLGESDNAYLSPERLSRFTNESQGSADVGMDVDVRMGVAVIVDVVDNSPAKRAGIVPGDRVLAIDGKNVRHWTTEEVSHALYGTAWSGISLTIEHPGTANPVTRKLQRMNVRRAAITRAELFADSVGYFRIGTFADGTGKALKRAIDDMLKRGATSLIVDVRGRSGGSLDAAVATADLFLDSAQLVITVVARDTVENRVYVDSTNQQWADLPMVVLVDAGTSSAAEVFAGALQDHDRAAVVGTTSFGKGSEQQLIPLDDTVGAVVLTSARWYTPLGRRIARLEMHDQDDDDKRTEFKSPAGRTILGGGGIVPDLYVSIRPRAIDTSVDTDTVDTGKVAADTVPSPGGAVSPPSYENDLVLSAARRLLHGITSPADLMRNASGADTIRVEAGSEAGL